MIDFVGFSDILRKFDLRNENYEIRSQPENGYTIYALYASGFMYKAGIGESALFELIGLLDMITEGRVWESQVVSRRQGLRYVRNRREWYPDTPLEEESVDGLEYLENPEDFRDNHFNSEILPDFRISLADVLPEQYAASGMP